MYVEKGLLSSVVEYCGHRGESLLDLCFVVLKLSIYCFCNKGYKNGMIGVVMIPSLGCHGPNPRRPVYGSDFDDILAFTTELFGLHEAWSCFVYHVDLSVLSQDRRCC